MEWKVRRRTSLADVDSSLERLNRILQSEAVGDEGLRSKHELTFSLQ